WSCILSRSVAWASPHWRLRRQRFDPKDVWNQPKDAGREKIFLGPLRYAFAIDRLANAPWIGGANGYIIRCVETSQTGAASDDDNAATAASCRHRRRRFRRAGSGLWPRRRAGQDHADRPPQPSSVRAAALPGRDRVA